MQASQERPRSVNLEDYIVLSPSDAGTEVEYCMQDGSRYMHLVSGLLYMVPPQILIE